jgi:peroxiredoxin
LSDFSTRDTARAFGVLRPDGMCNRTSFVVGKDGKIEFVDIGNTAIDPTATDEACSRLAHRAQETAK